MSKTYSDGQEKETVHNQNVQLFKYKYSFPTFQFLSLLKSKHPIAHKRVTTLVQSMVPDRQTYRPRRQQGR